MTHFIQGKIAIDQGELIPFSDFENDGPMWTGEGPREIRRVVAFGTPFATPPVVQVGFSMLDISNAAGARIDVTAEDIGRTGFVLRVGTWADSRIARVRVAWIAFGSCPDEDLWEIG